MGRGIRPAETAAGALVRIRQNFPAVRPDSSRTSALSSAPGMITGTHSARFLTALYAAIDAGADRRTLASELAACFGATAAEIGFWNGLTGGFETWAAPSDGSSFLSETGCTAASPGGASVAITRTRRGEPLLWAVIAHPPGDDPSLLAIRRGAGQRSFGRAHVARLQRLLPHLRRTLRVHQRLAHSNWECRLYQDALGSMDLAVMVVARGGGLRWSNEVADALLVDRRIVRLRNGKLRFAVAADHAAFGRALDAACADQGAEADLLRFDGADRVHLLVQVRPLRAATASTPPVAVVHARRYLSEPLPLQAKLARLYGLTRAEARVAEAIVNGDSLPQFCSKARITINTAKTLRKRAFAKFGCHSQGRLMQELLANPFLAARSPIDPQDPTSCSTAVRRATQLSQGAACASVAGASRDTAAAAPAAG